MVDYATGLRKTTPAQNTVASVNWLRVGEIYDWLSFGCFFRIGFVPL